MTSIRRTALGAALFGAAALAACQSSKPAQQPAPNPPANHAEQPDPAPPDTAGFVSGTGVIIHSDVEGGFYAIKGDDGTTYDPKSLPESFKVDGLRVRYTLKVDAGAAGIHMVGPIVDVINIANE
jgi:ABC-type oligopeptide transport system substrate-binding subunit